MGNKKLKIILKLFNSAMLVCMLHWTNAHAALPEEVNTLLTTMQAEKVVTSAITEINHYQLQKRLNARPDAPAQAAEMLQRTEQLKAFSALIEKQLGWKAIGPKVVQSYADELTTEQVIKLDAFFKTEAGRYYIESYQYAAAPVAISLDTFVDTLVDDVMDTPDKPLEKLKSIDANEAIASRLVARMRSKAEQEKFAAARVQFLAQINQLTKPDVTDKKAVSQQKKRMIELEQVYSLEQIDWRTARIINQKMAPDQMKQLLVSLDDDSLLSALQALSNASGKVNAILTEQIMSSPEFRELMGRMLKAG
jgi:hypothetical protein